MLTTSTLAATCPVIMGRDDFLGAKSVRYTVEPLPWDSSRAIRVRNLSDKLQSKYELENLLSDGTPSAERLQTAKRRLVALCVVDGDGAPLFTEADVKDMEETDGKLIAFAFSVAQKHCNIEATAKDALLKN